MTDDRRAYERHDVSVPVTFVSENTGTTYKGTIKNIGMGGVLMETVARLSPMDRLELHLSGGDAGTIKVPAVVVRYQLESSFGIAFVSLGRDDQARVRKLIDHFV